MVNSKKIGAAFALAVASGEMVAGTHRSFL